MSEKRRTVISKCQRCGEDFSHRAGRTPRCCSDLCAQRLRAENTPSRKLQRECPTCGKAFTCYPSNPVTHCSRDCHNEPRRVTATCPTCKKEYTYGKSWPLAHCSRACASKNVVKNIKHFAPSAYDTTCEQCGKAYRTTPKTTRGRFCSRDCWGKWQSVNYAGGAHPCKGQKRSRPKCWPPPTTLDCAVCHQAFVVKPKEAAKRRCCSKDCYATIQAAAICGENNFNWKGGYAPYYGPSWREAQRQARTRDECCQDCGVTPDVLERELDVHHIERFGNFGLVRHAEANVLTNLICYCPVCHLLNEPRRKKKTTRQ